MKCPECGMNLTRGKTWDFTDLARIVTKRHKCKHCGADVWSDASDGSIIKVNGKFVDGWNNWKRVVV